MLRTEYPEVWVVNADGINVDYEVFDSFDALEAFLLAVRRYAYPTWKAFTDPDMAQQYLREELGSDVEI
ncbi:MAG: hypothetical protein AMS18_00230 [Gemmatimonas sp. SG8_17]|nr:MAG: hypothetical protein AMS18_00230 [Gemmatimonas sp. SG8_17]